MTCNRCEKLGEENSCDPKAFCQCEPFKSPEYSSGLEQMADRDRLETEMACRTLTRKPSKKVFEFYEKMRIEQGLPPPMLITGKLYDPDMVSKVTESGQQALLKIKDMLDAYRNKDREFPTYEELTGICEEGLK